MFFFDVTFIMLGSNQHQETPSESRIDKMRKFLSSPLTRKKPTVLQLKTFGTPLDTLLQRAPSNCSVPFIITRLCQYIKQSGLTHEGLFRVSGNARSVERLRASFDRTGDAPLETEGDVPSAAALLKLFLRELPDPIIPLNMHCQFLNAVKDKEKSECVLCLAELVDKLPSVNYSILSYLSFFLKQVSDLEEQNRMSASSLGIVFGPNLFRVTEDFVGLKEQSLTNQIVTYFITDYKDIFKKDYFSENSDISSNPSHHQVPKMVSSWPETKGCSSAMLSSWSLGPLSVPMNSSDDTYLQSCSISYTMDGACSSPFALCKQDEPDFSVSQTDLSEKTITTDFTVHRSEITENHSFEDFSTASSLSLESQNLKNHSEASHAKSFSEIEAELSAAFRECSLASQSVELCNEFQFTSADKNSFDRNGYSENKMYSLDVGEISVRVPDILSKSSNEETEKVLEDSHKSYPRGRRRHVKHQKKQDYAREERRSHSELRSNSHCQNEDECNGNASYLSASSKQDPHHNSTGTLDENDPDLRHSWPAFRKCREEEDIALSPLPQSLEMNQCSEASVSPSAYRSYLSHRNPHLDPNLPPSPPVEQEDLATGTSLEDSVSNAKQLTRKVHALKKKIKLFEENFEKLYGYKPSNSEKCSNIAVKKMLAELNKAKQDLRQLKHEPALWNDEDGVLNKTSKGTNTHSSQGLFISSSGGAGNLSFEDSVKEAMDYLVRHRKNEKRPEALEEMTKEQLVAEKVLVQKVLLNFESLHGRPSSKAHRELVRPLYDRYRCTKRLLARLNSSKEPAELQPILEHETMDFPTSDQVKEKDQVIQSTKKVDDIATTSQSSQNDGKSLKSTSSPHINFHELSLSELMEELNRVREEKRKIRKMLRDFEEHFKKENGRKAQREDKRCMESFYTEYKNAKAKLKLLEALVAKHEQTS